LIFQESENDREGEKKEVELSNWTNECVVKKVVPGT
jgi:hypothetical protein